MTAVSELEPAVQQRLQQLQRKSEKVRYLHSLGMSTSAIARTVGVSYQHAYNVLHSPSPRSAAEPSVSARATLTANVEAVLLKEVDRFLKEHPGRDLGEVLDEALYLWCARVQERAIVAQYAASPSEDEQTEYAAWKRIRDSAATRLFRLDH